MNQVHFINMSNYNGIYKINIHTYNVDTLYYINNTYMYCCIYCIFSQGANLIRTLKINILLMLTL